MNTSNTVSVDLLLKAADAITGDIALTLPAFVPVVIDSPQDVETLPVIQSRITAGYNRANGVPTVRTAYVVDLSNEAFDSRPYLRSGYWAVFVADNGETSTRGIKPGKTDADTIGAFGALQSEYAKKKNDNGTAWRGACALIVNGVCEFATRI